MQHRLKKVDEVADFLNTSKQRVWDLVRSGHLPVIRLGERQYRWSDEILRQFIDGGGSVALSENGPGETPGQLAG